LPFLIERISGATDAAALSWHTGLITGTYILAIFLFAPLWGKISDRWGRRPVLLMGLTGFGASVALSALVEDLPLLYGGRFLDGLFAAAIAPAAYALVGDHAPSKEWRAHRFALINIAGTLGFFAGPLLGGLALSAFREFFAQGAERTFSTPFFTTSGLALVAALGIWGLVPRSGERKEITFAAVEKPSDRAVLLSLRGKQVLGLNASQIGMMFAECSLVMFAVQVLVFSPLVKPETTRWLFTPGLAILALSLFAVPFADTNVAMIVAVALVAASAGLLSPFVTYWVSLSAGETQGADLGRVTAAASLGQALGSAAGGLLFDVSILPGAAFTATAAMVLASLTASLGLPRRLQHDLALRSADAPSEGSGVSRVIPTLDR
jgi:DHA1 family multidrug resistance protein-like MFS transporter